MDYENEVMASECVGRACGFQLKEQTLACTQNGGSCMHAKFLEAEISAFHDEALAEATRKITQILADIPKDPDGREISLILTNMGSLLAWVDHSGISLDEPVTENDDDAMIAAALKLKSWAVDAASSN